MSDTEFDTALVTAAFRLAGEQGWRSINAARAARAAGLAVAEARVRFPSRASILLRFGVLADQAALLDAPNEGPVRDRLFDLLMRRFDVLQAHRPGVKALLRSLPADPPTALLLACATRRSMRWMLQGAGIDASGARGELQVRGLLAIWLWTVRTWERDESEDLSGTMAAVDIGLQRAEQVASWLHVRRRSASVAEATPAAEGAGELDPAHPPSRQSSATGPAASPDDAPLPEDLPLAEDAPPSEDRPLPEDRPVDDQPVDDQPVDDQPVEDRAPEDRAPEDRPPEGRPLAEGRPPGDRPATAPPRPPTDPNAPGTTRPDGKPPAGPGA
jgi:ubiquinone biosynthesis protein COQ9